MNRDHFFSDRMIGSQIYSIEMIEIVIVITSTEKYRDRIAILFFYDRLQHWCFLCALRCKIDIFDISQQLQ